MNLSIMDWWPSLEYRKKEIKNSLISSLCFQNVDNFILTDFGRLFRLSYLEFVSITMTQNL